MPGLFNPPEDEEREDPALPAGSIAVDLRDADGGAIPQEEVTLGVLASSVAKGESRKHLQATTDRTGRASFTGLETASNIAYRVSVGYQGALFAAAPFQLQQAKAMHVVLHVYPVTRDVQQARVVGEAALAAEVREDRIQMEEMLTIYNLGRTAWQPDGVTMALPDGASAFSAQTSMTDQGVDESGGQARLRGTFPPGKGVVEFRWQLPWNGESDVDFSVGLPPHVAIARVMMAAGGTVKLSAAGFPPAERRHDAQGQSFLVTERHLRPDEPKLSALSVGIHDLPSAGVGRNVAAFLAGLGVLVGLLLATRRTDDSRTSTKAERASVLEELLMLERARASGDVGPKTYERARRELIDALARVLARKATP